MIYNKRMYFSEHNLRNICYKTRRKIVNILESNWFDKLRLVYYDYRNKAFRNILPQCEVAED
jgi:hypothetical protein